MTSDYLRQEEKSSSDSRGREFVIRASKGDREQKCSFSWRPSGAEWSSSVFCRASGNNRPKVRGPRSADSCFGSAGFHISPPSPENPASLWIVGGHRWPGGGSPPSLGLLSLHGAVGGWLGDRRDGGGGLRRSGGSSLSATLWGSALSQELSDDASFWLWVWNP